MLTPPLQPMDIDGLIEYKNKAVIFYEVKLGKKELPEGQRIALERLANDIALSGRKAVSIIVEHNVADPKQSVMLADCIVRAYYLGNKTEWKKPSGVYTAKQYTNMFLDWVDKE